MIEDEPQLLGFVRSELKRSGFVVDCCENGADGFALGLHEDFDAVVLDLGLPDMAGMDILKGWRRAGRDFPVLILSARASWPERVSGLNAGADDYLAKPFEPEELSARLQALIRRRHGRADSVIRHGELEINLSDNAARLAGQPLDLTATEHRILVYLLMHKTRIVSEAELSDHIYDLESSRLSNGVQVYISRLRRKLGRDFIKTLRGMGYRLG